MDAGRGALAGVGVAHGNSEDPDGRRGSGCGELSRGDVSRRKRHAREQNPRAVQEVAASNGEVERTRIDRSGTYRSKGGSRVEKCNVTRPACGRIRGTRRLNRNRV